MSSISLIAPASYERFDDLLWPRLLSKLREILPEDCSINFRYETRQIRVEAAYDVSVAQREEAEGALREVLSWTRKTCDKAFSYG